MKYPPGFKVKNKGKPKNVVVVKLTRLFVRLKRQMRKNEKINQVHLAILHKWLTYKSSMKT